MSDLTTYRIGDLNGLGHVDNPNTGNPGYPIAAEMLEDMLQGGVLVRDTRLQAIVDAPRCVHGNIYPHPKGKFEDEGYTIRHCVGAPKLAALLDALTEENNDESA